MPTLTLTYNGANGQPHDWSHVQTPLDEIKTLLNTTKLDTDNVQQYGLRADRLRAYAGALSGAIKVRNASGGSITANDLLYISGTYSDGTDNYPSVAQAIATATGSTNYPAILVADATIANGADGTAYIVKGISSVATNGAAVGDPVYLSTVAGGWTLTRPTSNQFVQVVGYVEVVHASTGRIVLCPQGGARRLVVWRGGRPGDLAGC